MSGQMIVKPTADSIATAARMAAKGRGLPPVEQWNPPFCGDLDIRISRDGTWFYMGTPIERPELARVFSTILKREGDKYFLVTPVEKVGITVDDAPFLAVDFHVTGSGSAQVLEFTTSMGDQTKASAENPLRIERDADTGEPAPYVHVRRGLEALIDRKSFYRLIDIGTHHDGWFGLWSSGVFFPIIKSTELP
ncbi:MAG TPA: DUF1285 domain-containing protein [Rhodobacteraceae bacterium]|jgi:hypothetical protein|nr:DUF1285 domain-containing protein [Paracoccaceae bacterium]HBV55503.1 DUF1285 domain-containing protein [Paracoccaceae bacterium]